MKSRLLCVPAAAIVLAGTPVRAFPDEVVTTRLSADETRIDVVSFIQSEEGDTISVTNGYTQLATGQNWWDPVRKTWQGTLEQIDLAKIGAVAFNGQQKVYFAPTLDDPSGTVQLLTADGQKVRSSVLALCYLDPLSGRRATFGLARDVPGELVPPNQAVYRDAFAAQDPNYTVHADVVYTYRMSGTEQDIVFRSMPPDPEVFGFSGKVARLEVLTEFFEAPTPQKTVRLLASVDDPVLRAQLAIPDWEDEHLDFGSFGIGNGRAFRLGQNSSMPLAGEDGYLVVAKKWIEDPGRRVLAESVEYSDVAPVLQSLQLERQGAKASQPATPGQNMDAGRSQWSEQLAGVIADPPLNGIPLAYSKSVLPARPTGRGAGVDRPMLLATRLVHDSPGVVIDYLPLAQNLTNYTFRGDETYFVNAPVNLVGTTTLEGGTVIKYDAWAGGTNPPQRLIVQGPFVSGTTPYRPAIFTARDDQSVGQYITNSLAVPSAGVYYGTEDLWFQTDASSPVLENVRFRYCSHAVLFTQRSGTVRNAQFQFCNAAVYGDHAASVKVQNALILDTTAGGQAFVPYLTTQMSGENVTVCNAPTLRFPDGTASLALTNCLLVAAVTGGDVYTGLANAVYASSTNLFKTVGAGSYYLADNSTNRDAGVSTVDPVLLAQLRRGTTFAPEILTNDFVGPSPSTLSPSVNVPRDTNAVDRGYHYLPLDYCLTTLNVTNCTLALTNGVAIGIFGPKGLVLRERALLTSDGSPTLLNRITRYNTVQEQTNNWGSASSNSFALLDVNVLTASLGPGIQFRFTEASHLAITTNSTTARRFLAAGSGNLLKPLALSHCQLRGVHLDITYAGSDNQTVALTNNLFEGCALSFMDLAGFGTYTLSARNNLFRGGRVTFDNQDAFNTWTIKDNLFDCDVASATNTFTASNNGFRSGLTTFGTSAKSGLVPDYQTGPLGRYYYPTGGAPTSLTNLVDTGSQSATNVGLWHYTTTIDLKKEANSIVDIGFHYLATDTNANALDADKDGIPDYVLDPTGRGLGDSDYDGITDAEEVANGKDPSDPGSTVMRRLSYWRFNNSGNWTNEAGIAPLTTNSLLSAGSWSGTAVYLTNTSSQIKYPTLNSDGTALVNLRNGTVRLWFRPDWTSKSLGGAGIASGHSALFQVGPDINGITWALSLWSSGNELDLVSRQRLSNGDVVQVDAFHQDIAWTNGYWHEIGVTYTPSNAACYLDGQLASFNLSADLRPRIVATNDIVIPAGTSLPTYNLGEGIRFFPDYNTRLDGVRVGHRCWFDGAHNLVTSPSVGRVDEIQTFNYPLTSAQIAAGFHSLPADASPSPLLDTDYDGRSDFAESQVDGTSTNNAASVPLVRLGYWRFNDPFFTGEMGQTPINTNAVAANYDWSGFAADLSGATPLAYRDVETNGWPNINCSRGGIQVWLRPSWSGATPPTNAPLLWMGDPANPTSGFWTLRFGNGDGTLRFVTSSNNVTVTNLTASVSLITNRWYHLALNFTSTNSALYTNGVLAASGSGVSLWPTAAARAAGFVLGNDSTGTRSAKSAIDELEIWNAPLTTSSIGASFAALSLLDSDLDGILDVAEDMSGASAGRPFLGEPSAVTGAFEAEQYDHGEGVGYHAAVNANNTTYRPGRLPILATTDALPNGAGGSDALGGFDVALAAGDWARYTLDVRVAGTYAVEARVAGYGTGGTFKCELSTPSSTNYATTGTLSVPGTNWSTVGTTLLSLAAGPNYLKLSAVANASGQSYAGKFNYLTVYPSWNEGIANIGTNETTVAGLAANDDSWTTATNNAARIRAAIDSVNTSPTQGGRVNIPAGVYYIGQTNASETSLARSNTALYVSKSFLEIKGAGRTNTQLIAHNRATTVFYLGMTNGPAQRAVTNVTLRDLTIAGRPHRIVNGTNATTWTDGWLAAADGVDTGSLVVCDGLNNTTPTVGILVTSCRFQNPTTMAWRMNGGSQWVSQLAFRNNEFLDRVTPEGMLTNSSAIFGGITTNHPVWTSAHIMGALASCHNVLVISNSFNGNVGIGSGPDPTPYNGGDGLLWLQSDGNWYAADNVVTNYYLEGIQLNGGPAAVVRNRFVTSFANGSTTALNTVGQYQGPSGALRPDMVYSVLANTFFQGRHVNLGQLSTLAYVNTGYRLNLAGNRASSYPMPALDTNLPAVFCGTHTNLFLNVSGNAVTNVGSALSIAYCGGVAYVLGNDFGGTQFRGILDDGYSALWQSAVLSGNIINRGDSDHLRTRLGTAPKWFLRANTYRAGSTNAGLQLDHPSLPVHLAQ